MIGRLKCWQEAHRLPDEPRNTSIRETASSKALSPQKMRLVSAPNGGTYFISDAGTIIHCSGLAQHPGPPLNQTTTPKAEPQPPPLQVPEFIIVCAKYDCGAQAAIAQASDHRVSGPLSMRRRTDQTWTRVEERNDTYVAEWNALKKHTANSR